MLLSKSDFKVAQDCPTKLFYKKSRYPSRKDEDLYLRLLAEGGFMIEKMAKLLFPDGVDLGVHSRSEEAARDTVAALQAQDGVFFEATFISGYKLARVDILQKRGNELHLIEVKSTSYSAEENDAAIADGLPNLFRSARDGSILTGWRDYLEDVTFQVLVLQEVFPDAVIRPFLLMPDKSKTTNIDRLYSLFDLRRVRTPGSSFDRLVVDYHGDVEELRQNHFLTQVPVDAEVALLIDEVREKAERYVTSLNPNLTKIVTPLSVACRSCEYRAGNADVRDGFKECWGTLADVSPHLLDLYRAGTVGGRSGPVANELIATGNVSLFDWSEDSLVRSDGVIGETNKRQRIQIRHTRENSEWFSDELAGLLRSFAYPLHFIDFETTALAVPYHAGMRPYEPVAFQWSCHTVTGPDAAPAHSEWINIEEAFPNFEFARTLMNQIGSDGTVFMWASHENTILRRILDQMEQRSYHDSELEEWLRGIVRVPEEHAGRLVDMNQLTLKHYFHPMMKGRTSIKIVFDALWKTNPALREEFPEYLRESAGEILSPYAALPPLAINGSPVVVAEGTGAIRAYEAMLYGIERNDPTIREAWKNLLLQYCKLDTLAMVWIWQHWNTQRR